MDDLTVSCFANLLEQGIQFKFYIIMCVCGGGGGGVGGVLACVYSCAVRTSVHTRAHMKAK